ncbi:MAG: F0F1 ATP synthase subunit delta [Pseudomonadota bacterium]
MADNQTLARPYAQALFDLARETNALEQWSGALDVARQIAGNADVLATIHRPSIGAEQRLELITGIANSLGDNHLLGGSSAEGKNFLRLLLENDRFGVLPEIADHFEALKAETEQTVDATVTSASELGGDQLAKIRDALASRLGQRVTVTNVVDPELIGGAVISAGDFVIDGSVRSRLARLANTLTQ